ERGAFEKHFLATPERHKKLRFGRAFKRYLSSQAQSPATAETGQFSGFWTRTRSAFSSPLGIAAFAILVIGIAFGFWRIFFHQSEVDKGLMALNAAYREQRPLESRISQFNYAPYVVTRGPGDEKLDRNELNRAELMLLEEINRNPTPTVRHALGRVF